MALHFPSLGSNNARHNLFHVTPNDTLGRHGIFSRCYSRNTQGHSGYRIGSRNEIHTSNLDWRESSATNQFCGPGNYVDGSANANFSQIVCLVSGLFDIVGRGIGAVSQSISTTYYRGAASWSQTEHLRSTGRPYWQYDTGQIRQKILLILLAAVRRRFPFST